MITMKLDKDRIAKIKSNIKVDLEFSQEAWQECKSFEPFDLHVKQEKKRNER